MRSNSKQPATVGKCLPNGSCVSARSPDVLKQEEEEEDKLRRPPAPGSVEESLKTFHSFLQSRMNELLGRYSTVPLATILYNSVKEWKSDTVEHPLFSDETSRDLITTYVLDCKDMHAVSIGYLERFVPPVSQPRTSGKTFTKLTSASRNANAVSTEDRTYTTLPSDVRIRGMGLESLVGLPWSPKQ